MNDPVARGRVSGKDFHLKAVASHRELNPLVGLIKPQKVKAP
jgi:hypothetical protein